jgi:hypothetical protein
VLDANGEAAVYLGASAYKFDLFSALDVHQPNYPIDHVVQAAVWPVVVATVQSTPGATLTAAALIPAGAAVLVVSTKILVGCGTSGGLTAFAIGDGALVDRWGVQTVLTAGALSGGSDATAGAQARDASFPRYPTAQAVVLTALGGTFDGTGEVEMAVQYLTLPHRSA